MFMGAESKLTREEINDRLANENRQITMIGEYTNKDVPTLFKCGRCDHEWIASPNNVRRKTGCPKCSGKYRPTTEEFNQWLILDGRGIRLIGEYKAALLKTSFGCSNGHQWESKPNDIKNGNGCPYCADHGGGGFKPGKPAWEYGFIRDGYLKIGITNNIEQRLRKHRQYGPIDLVHCRYREIGQQALDWENRLKKLHGGKYVTKERCPDGWTETFPCYLTEELNR